MATKKRNKRQPKKSPVERMTREERVKLFWQLVSRPEGIHLTF